MRKVIYSIGVSLDGFIAARDGDIELGCAGSRVASLPRRADASGRRRVVRPQALRTMLFWDAPAETFSGAEAIEFAQIWKSVPKIVFSTTLPGARGDASLATGDVASVVKRLKEEPDGDIAVGGAGLASTLIGRRTSSTSTASSLAPSCSAAARPLPFASPEDRVGASRGADVWRERRLPALLACAAGRDRRFRERGYVSAIVAVSTSRPESCTSSPRGLALASRLRPSRVSGTSTSLDSPAGSDERRPAHEHGAPMGRRRAPAAVLSRRGELVWRRASDSPLPWRGAPRSRSARAHLRVASSPCGPRSRRRRAAMLRAAVSATAGCAQNSSSNCLLTGCGSIAPGSVPLPPGPAEPRPRYPYSLTGRSNGLSLVVMIALIPGVVADALTLTGLATSA